MELVYDRGTLTIQAAQHVSLQPHFKWDSRTLNWRAPAWRYHEVAGRLGEEHGDHFSDRVPSWSAASYPSEGLNPLRADQQEALDRWQAAAGRGLVVMPTGTGKTEVGLSAIAASGTSTLVVCPIRDLMYQWHRRLHRAFGMDAGVLGDGLHQIRPLTVTTYDSAFIYMEEIGNRFGLVIFDEVHHLAGVNLRQAAEMCAAPRRLGLTATLERLDGQHSVLLEWVGPVVYRQEVSEARGRTLAEYETIRIPVHLTPQEQSDYDRAAAAVRGFIADRRKTAPAYDWQDACSDASRDPAARRAMKAFRFKTSIEDRAVEKLRILEDLFRLHAQESVLVFAGSNTMAMDISKRFLIPVLLHHSRKDERFWILDGFSSGKIRAVVANQVLDEGIDVPEVKVAVVLGGLTSTRQAKQRLGRILRRSGDARAVLYEVVCQETREIERAKQRRQSDAYEGSRVMREPTLQYRVRRQ